MFRYDKDLDGKLRFTEFEDLILPLDDNYRALVLKRVPYCNTQDYARMQFFLDTTTQKLKRTL